LVKSIVCIIFAVPTTFDDYSSASGDGIRSPHGEKDESADGSFVGKIEGGVHSGYFLPVSGEKAVGLRVV
jgi:hypothetical protein